MLTMREGASAAAKWSPIVERLESSRLSVREFARREGVNESTLYWWRWKLRSTGGLLAERSMGFVELHVASSAALHEPTVRVSGHERPWSVEVPASFDPTALRRLLEALA